MLRSSTDRAPTALTTGRSPGCRSPSCTYSRSLALFRKVLGPDYDLSALWDKRLEYEFV
jgi:hypothetical protein